MTGLSVTPQGKPEPVHQAPFLPQPVDARSVLKLKLEGQNIVPSA